MTKKEKLELYMIEIKLIDTLHYLSKQYFEVLVKVSFLFWSAVDLNLGLGFRLSLTRCYIKLPYIELAAM